MQSAANDVIFGTVIRTPSELCSLIQVLMLLIQDTVGIFQDIKIISPKDGQEESKTAACFS